MVYIYINICIYIHYLIFRSSVFPLLPTFDGFDYPYSVTIRVRHFTDELHRCSVESE